MKRPFDRIVGPDGVWTDGVRTNAAEVVGEDGLTAREDFAFRCLNAAANLYGILTMDEFISLYNGYAKHHEPTVARPMTKDELGRLIDYLIEFCEPPDEEESDLFEDIADRPDRWFDVWDHRATGQRLIVQDQFTDVLPDGTPKSTEEYEDDYRHDVEAMISRTLRKFVKVEMKRLDEDAFLER